MEQNTDRREHTRYCAHHLDVLIKSRLAESGLWETGAVVSADFNRFGIAIETEHCFAMGDVLSLIIRTDDSTITEVSGVICNRIPCDGGYRLGVRFVNNAESEEGTEQNQMFNQALLNLEQEAAQKVH